MRGMFVVSRENILHIKKEVYQNLLKSLSVGDNIENGHFAERIWAHLFRQYSFDKLKINETEGFLLVQVPHSEERCKDVPSEERCNDVASHQQS